MSKRAYNVDLTLSPMSPSRGKSRKAKTEREQSASAESSSSSDGASSSSEDGTDPWRLPLCTPSASSRVLDVLSGCHHFSLNGFSLARSLGCGTRLCSDFFEVAGAVFRLEVYPAGFTADCRKHISAFLTTPSNVNPKFVIYEVAILDQSGKDRHISVSRDRTRIPGGVLPMHLSNHRGIVAAIPTLAKLKELEKKPKRYLPYDTLAIRANIHLMHGWSSYQGALSGYAHPSTACLLPSSLQPALPGPFPYGYYGPQYSPLGGYMGCQPQWGTPAQMPPAHSYPALTGSYMGS